MHAPTTEAECLFLRKFNEGVAAEKFPVICRMYQLNFDGNDSWTYKEYWDRYENHFLDEI